MTEQELIQENEKLTARLKKAVEVFNEQKATIARLTEEVESLKTKAEQANEKDNEFFDQVNEIENLKAELAEANDNYFTADKKVQELTVRIAKATDEYKKLKSELETANQVAEAEKAVSQKLSDKLNRLKAVLDEE